MKIQCAKCTVTHTVEHKRATATAAQCPQCCLPFWYGQRSSKSGGKVTMGIEPQNVDQWLSSRGRKVGE